MSKKQLESAILRALSDRTALHVMDLAEQIEEHPLTVDKACAQLHEDGYITTSSHGIYDVTTYGERRLDNSCDTHHQRESSDTN